MAQGQIPRLSPGTEPASLHPVPADTIREQLKRVLASHEFRSTKRSQDFLRYVVENTLEGHADSLKERTIGVDVFSRPASYDPSDDATVRVKAGEVRKRLGLYYAGEGAHDPVRIELPAGTYVPEFHPLHSELPIPASAPAIVLPEPGRASIRWRSSKIKISAALASIVLAAVAFWWFRHPPAPTVLDEFWRPVLQGMAPVSVCAAFVPVWNLDRDANSKAPVRIEDFVPLTDQFVGGGDLVAVSRISAMLTRLQRPYRVRIGNEISLYDLRSAPAILVGYSHTRWKEISKELRFFIDIDKRPLGVTDRNAPTKWTLPNLPRDHRTEEDYAIVSRVFHPDTHTMLVELSGITQYGTDAAADLVTNADLLGDALRGSPSGWQDKNLQLVLHVKVISGAPSSPRVVASHFW